MGFWKRRRVSLVAIAIVVGACGSGSNDAALTTRPPITTTLAPAPTTATTTVAPSSSVAPVSSSSTTTTSTTTTVPEELPDSIGTADDPSVAEVPAGATRTFYAGVDESVSLRQNVLGDMQILFYDVYAPASAANGLTALYFHSGGIDGGYANSDEAVATCRQMSALGAWCVSVEYRRGYAGFEQLPVAATSVTPAQADRFSNAYTDARNDAAEAWFHLDGEAESIGLPRRYVLVGLEAGAQIASDIALATSGLPYDIAGLIASSGTHRSSRSLSGVPEFPVVLQTGLFDTAAPPYSGNLYLDPDMPQLVGARSLYNQLAAADATVHLYVNAQQGHGLGVYEASSGGSEFYGDAMQLFLAAPAEPNAAFEYRFTCSDANFGAAGPGVRISSAQLADFRYEPYESDMESGLTPEESLELHPPEFSGCEA